MKNLNSIFKDMKKVLLSVVLMFAVCTTSSVMAQNVKKDACCQKTECPKACSKDTKCCKSEEKKCCQSGEKKCCKANAERNCCKESKPTTAGKDWYSDEYNKNKASPFEKPYFFSPCQKNIL